jgi:hypothetical protein
VARGANQFIIESKMQKRFDVCLNIVQKKVKKLAMKGSLSMKYRMDEVRSPGLSKAKPVENGP